MRVQQQTLGMSVRVQQQTLGMSVRAQQQMLPQKQLGRNAVFVSACVWVGVRVSFCVFAFGCGCGCAFRLSCCVQIWVGAHVVK